MLGKMMLLILQRSCCGVLLILLGYYALQLRKQVQLQRFSKLCAIGRENSCRLRFPLIVWRIISNSIGAIHLCAIDNSLLFQLESTTSKRLSISKALEHFV